MKKIDKDAFIEWFKINFGYVLGGFCILILVLLLILVSRQIVITVIGMFSILMLALEKRARVFDKVVSMLVIFSLAIGFMMFG